MPLLQKKNYLLIDSHNIVIFRYDDKDDDREANEEGEIEMPASPVDTSPPKRGASGGEPSLKAASALIRPTSWRSNSGLLVPDDIVSDYGDIPPPQGAKSDQNASGVSQHNTYDRIPPPVQYTSPRESRGDSTHSSAVDASLASVSTPESRRSSQPSGGNSNESTQAAAAALSGDGAK